MSIILREYEWAEDMIRIESLGKKPSETLRRVARYYIDQGYSNKQVRQLLETFIMRCEPSSSIPKWSNAIDAAISRALKFKAIDIERIDVSKPEMEIIDRLEGRQLKRLAFTLLCLAKYWKRVSPDGDYWVNSKDNEIMAMANINTSIKRQSQMYWTLKELGLIRFSKKVDNTNVCVEFVKDGDPALSVTDFRNLGYQYLKYHGEPYFECENCGITTKINEPRRGRTQKYCKECAVSVNTQQRVNSIMRNNQNKRLNSTPLYTVYAHIAPNLKMYVGTTSTSLNKRWKKGVGYADNSDFSSDILKYGWDKIKHYKVIETEDASFAKKVEDTLTQGYRSYDKKTGYNVSFGNSTHKYDVKLFEKCSFKEVDSRGI